MSRRTAAPGPTAEAPDSAPDEDDSSVRRSRPWPAGERPRQPADRDADPRLLDRDRLSDHLDRLFRAAWALCGSRHDAEDLVQETFLNVLKRPRVLHGDNELGYLLRALRNTHASWYRSNARRRADRPLSEADAAPAAEADVSSREIMQAIASAPEPYREAVIAVDLMGLSYGEAARTLRTREATVTSRLYRGRQHVARVLTQATCDA